eukprot:561160-Rhodomonas_salina.2
MSVLRQRDTLAFYSEYDERYQDSEFEIGEIKLQGPIVPWKCARSRTTTFCMYTFHDKLKFESSIFLPITTSEDGNIDKIPIDMR